MIEFHYSSNNVLTIQLFLKIITLLINVYLFRKLDKDLFAFFYVSISMFQFTITYVSQNVIKRTIKVISISKYKYVNYIFISFTNTMVIGVLVSYIWQNFIQAPESISKKEYKNILSTFVISHLISLSGDIYLTLQSKNEGKINDSLAKDILMFYQKTISFIIIIFQTTSITHSLCIGQFVGSLIFIICCFLFWKNILSLCKAYSSVKPINLDDKKKQYGKGHKNYDITTIEITRSNFLYFATKYLIIITKFISFQEQAIFSLVENLLTTLSQLFLKPIIDNFYTYFNIDCLLKYGNSRTINENSISTFKKIIKLCIIIGFVVFAFCTPYFHIVAKIIGGDVLFNNNGPRLLSIYSIYVILISINTILENILVSIKGNMKINTYQKYFYIIYSVVLIFSYLITQNNGLTGIMVLNIFYILFLIFYNFYKISIKERKFVKPINEFFPTLNSLVLLIFASLVTRLSYLIFGTAEGIINNAAHMAIGGIMLIVFIFQLLQNDFPKYNPMHCLLEKTHCN